MKIIKISNYVKNLGHGTTMLKKLKYNKINRKKEVNYKRFHIRTKWVYSNCTYQVGQNGDNIFETNNSILALKVDAYRTMYMRSIR